MLSSSRHQLQTLAGCGKTSFRNEIAADRYDDLLNIIPTAVWIGHGFLVGEAMSHRQCRVMHREDVSTFSAFVRIGGKHFEADESMTAAEFRALDPVTVLRPAGRGDSAQPQATPK